MYGVKSTWIRATLPVWHKWKNSQCCRECRQLSRRLSSQYAGFLTRNLLGDMCPACVCICASFFFIVCPCIKFNAKSGTRTQSAEGAMKGSLGFGMISSCKYSGGTKARSALVITSVPSLDTTPPPFAPPSNTPAPGLSENQMKRGPVQSCFVCVCDEMFRSLLWLLPLLVWFIIARIMISSFDKCT